MTAISTISKPSIVRILGAAAVAGLVVAGEYFFRHYVLFWLPTIGNLLVNDMLSLFLAYTLILLGLGLFLHTHWREEFIGVAQALRDNLTSNTFTLWILALMLSLVTLSPLDQLLWGKVQLPMLISVYHNPTVWLAEWATILKTVTLILVNGLFVPVAEEYAWRGLVQARLLEILPTPIAIGLTALLFSLKHVIVDASLGRFLTLIAFGVICGIVAQRSSWRGSAALHLFVNTAITVMALILGLE